MTTSVMIIFLVMILKVMMIPHRFSGSAKYALRLHQLSAANYGKRCLLAERVYGSAIFCQVSLLSQRYGRFHRVKRVSNVAALFFSITAYNDERFIETFRVSKALFDWISTELHSELARTEGASSDCTVYIASRDRLFFLSF